jgi:hypothetical protein
VFGCTWGLSWELVICYNGGEGVEGGLLPLTCFLPFYTASPLETLLPSG